MFGSWKLRLHGKKEKRPAHHIYATPTPNIYDTPTDNEDDSLQLCFSDRDIPFLLYRQQLIQSQRIPGWQKTASLNRVNSSKDLLLPPSTVNQQHKTPPTPPERRSSKGRGFLIRTINKASARGSGGSNNSLLLVNGRDHNSKGVWSRQGSLLSLSGKSDSISPRPPPRQRRSSSRSRMISLEDDNTKLDGSSDLSLNSTMSCFDNNRLSPMVPARRSRSRSRTRDTEPEALGQAVNLERRKFEAVVCELSHNPEARLKKRPSPPPCVAARITQGSKTVNGHLLPSQVKESQKKQHPVVEIDERKLQIAARFWNSADKKDAKEHKPDSEQEVFKKEEQKCDNEPKVFKRKEHIYSRIKKRPVKENGLSKRQSPPPPILPKKAGGGSPAPPPPRSGDMTLPPTPPPPPLLPKKVLSSPLVPLKNNHGMEIKSDQPSTTLDTAKTNMTAFERSPLIPAKFNRLLSNFHQPNNKDSIAKVSTSNSSLNWEHHLRSGEEKPLSRSGSLVSLRIDQQSRNFGNLLQEQRLNYLSRTCGLTPPTRKRAGLRGRQHSLGPRGASVEPQFNPSGGLRVGRAGSVPVQPEEIGCGGVKKPPVSPRVLIKVFS